MDQHKRKTVLFVVMEFPPVNSTGNYRSLKFVKYLTNFGIDPVVVTLKEEQASDFFSAPINETLLQEIPEETSIYRVHCKNGVKGRFQKLRNFLRIYFSVNDDLAKRWRPFLLPKLGEIIKKHKPSIVYTSIPPFSSGLLGREISLKYKLPLVLDMRDLWAHFGSAPLRSYLHYKLMVKREKSIFGQATKILPVTPQMSSTIKRVHPQLDPSKLEVITNGFDRDSSGLTPFSFSKNQDKIVIGYVGSFYYEPEMRDSIFTPWWKKKPHKMLEYSPSKQDWLYRSPYFFLKTISHLKKHQPEFGSRISIEFVGRNPQWLTNMVTEFGLTDCFTSHGFVPKEKVGEIIQGFDAFLATAEKIENEEHYCLPSKIFDYVGINKPILGFVTEGIQKEFIEKSGLGIACDPDNIDQSTQIITDLIQSGATFTPSTEYLYQFQRETLAEKLSETLHNIKT